LGPILAKKIAHNQRGFIPSFVKISAYADDTAVHLGSLADIKIYCLLLRQYALATGGVTNFYKSKGVLCGRWRNLAPNLGIKVAKSSKYLGVITGYDSSMAQKAIAESERLASTGRLTRGTTKSWYAVSKGTKVPLWESRLDHSQDIEAAVTQGDDLNSPNTINPLPTQDVYLVTGRDEEGYKIKTTLEQILTIEEDMRPTEQYGLAFIKRNENSRLYQAQMFRSSSTPLRRMNGSEIIGWTLKRSANYTSARLHTPKSKGSCGYGAATPFQQAPGSEARMPTQHAHTADK
jgi:hypothetical protein